ncbi:hypothetical protein BDR05DRAFT_1025613 [Suillus weaverae]|nr:hypothetical protein BDR05DRAFT_1025613 [Suillus weaverae]
MSGAGRGRLCADGAGWASSVVVCRALRGAVGRVEADNGGQHWKRECWSPWEGALFNAGVGETSLLSQTSMGKTHKSSEILQYKSTPVVPSAQEAKGVLHAPF